MKVEKISGILLIDKPKEFSSFDVVRRIKKVFPKNKVGHFGTLDPIATGLLIIGIGKATKFFDLFKKESKTYRAKAQLGITTDTYDITGKIVKETKDFNVSYNELTDALKSFIGETLQTPPMFSAKKFKGKPLYKLAREGKEVERKPVKINIDYLELLSYESPFFDFIVSSSSGTYIRSLINDLGELLGCGATMVELRRTEIGGYKVEHALTLDEFETEVKRGKIFNFIIPVEKIFPEFPKIIVSPRGEFLASNGALVPAEEVLKVEGVSDEYFKLFNDEGKFLCLAKPELTKRAFKPVIVLK